MTIILKPEGESMHIGFTASSSWHAVVLEGMSWLEVSPAEGEGGSTYLTVKALSNETFETRTAVLNVMSEGEGVYINFEQATNVTPVMEIAQNTFEVPAEGGVVDVHIKTNLEYRFDILDSWITEEKAKALVLPTNLHRLRVAPNNTTEERTGVVTVCANQQCIPITIRQAASEGGDPGQEGGGDTGNGQISSGDNYEHDHVLRMLLTDVSGETVTIPEDNSVWKKTYTGTLPSGSVASDMRVLVYVEKPYGERSKASGVGYVIYGDYGDTYVDNARSVGLGTTAGVEYK